MRIGKIIEELGEAYGINLFKESLGGLLKGKVVELPPERVKVEKDVVKIQQPLLIFEVKLVLGVFFARHVCLL